MVAPLQFAEGYSEDVTLRDGFAVRLRLLQSSDKALLQEGLLQLSPKSQYLRFFTAKPRLTDAELAYLTEIDGYDHFAIVAGEIGEDGTVGDGVGVARFIRLPEDPRVAEPAIVVIDAFHGKGVGGLLMNRLAQAALERDVQIFRSEFLATNGPAKGLFTSMSDVVRFSADGTVAIAELPLARQLPARVAATETGRRAPMDELFGLVAAQVLQVRRRFAMLLDPDQLLGALRKLADELGIPTGRPDA